MEGYSLGSDALIIEAPSPPIESPFGGVFSCQFSFSSLRK